jgi:class 3 adenylate cyclase
MDDRAAMKRRLAAILAADIAGYSRLMGEDEAVTVHDLSIRGARFVTLAGRNHLFLETEPAFGQFLEHTRAFLAG